DRISFIYRKLLQIPIDFGEKRNLVQGSHFSRQINEPINLALMRMNGPDFERRFHHWLRGGRSDSLRAPTENQSAGKESQEDARRNRPEGCSAQWASLAPALFADEICL